MLSELGHYTLIIALGLSIMQPFKQINNYGAILYLLVNFALISLFYNYLVSEFSIINIIENSHSAEPFIYKLTGLWGNHEGSILLWCWVIALYTYLVNLTSKSIQLNTNFQSIQAIINAVFLAFLLFTSNPYIRSSYFIEEGFELNPILQDPGLIIHPPLLYLGYIGFSIPFSLSLSILMLLPKERAGSKHLNNIYQILNKNFNELYIWTLIPWCFLTIGISLGSWWAYYELGWGGWWFWDPVENASLMPWLLSTASLHTIQLAKKRNTLYHWMFLLSLLTFQFSLLGTFFVRSGLLASVHSFANDSTRGLFIFIFLIVIFITAAYFYLSRLKIFRVSSITHKPYLSYYRTTFFTAYSKESSFIVNNFIFIISAFTILAATIAPVIFSTLYDRQISIGEPFFHQTLIPLLIPTIIVMGLSPLIPYSSIKLTSYLNQYLYFYVFLGFYILTVNMFFWILNYHITFLMNLIILLTLWLLSHLSMVIYYLKLFKRPYLNAMTLSHLGFLILFLAVSISSMYQFETVQIMKPGDQLLIKEVLYTLRGINYVEGHNYHAITGNFLIDLIHQGTTNYTLSFPEKRFYFVQGMFTTKSTILTNMLVDIYSMLGEGNIQDGWFTRFFYNPGMPFIWIAPALFVLGALQSIKAKKKSVEFL